MVNVGTFYYHLEYFMAIWNNVWQFGIVCGHLLYFFPIWYVWTKKNLATLVGCLQYIGKKVFVFSAQIKKVLHFSPLPPNRSFRRDDLDKKQGCQIFPGTTYQNRGKYTKLPQNIPNGLQIS
jgi:hypothetical protein